MPTICSMFYESPSKNNLAIIPFGTLLVVFDTEVLYFPGLDLSAQLYSIHDTVDPLSQGCKAMPFVIPFEAARHKNRGANGG